MQLQGSSQLVLDLVFISLYFSENNVTGVFDGNCDHWVIAVFLPLKINNRDSTGRVAINGLLNADDISY